MGIQPTNIPKIDFRNPNSSMSQPGTPGGSNSSLSAARNARNRARFGQGSNSKAGDYNKFLDPNNAENWRGAGQPGTRGNWQGAPGAQSGGGFNSDAYEGSRKWALGGQGSYLQNSVQMDRNSNYPDTTSRIQNSNQRPTANPMPRPNPLFNMPQTTTRPDLNSETNSAFLGLNRPYTLPTIQKPDPASLGLNRPYTLPTLTTGALSRPSNPSQGNLNPSNPSQGNLNPNKPRTKPMYNQQYEDGSNGYMPVSQEVQNRYPDRWY